MKNILNITLLIISFICFYSCEIDNYEGPDAQISGRILDHNGNLLRTEPGSSNMRIQMDELSWTNGDTSIAVIPRYLNVKIDGTYTNTKIFSGTYRILPVEGAFYPYNDGDTIVIGGSVTKDFVVIPYLDVNWVEEPHLTADSCVEASISFLRNSKDGEFMPDVLNARLCISSNQYVGNNNYYSDLISGATTVTNAMDGTTITLKSKKVKYFNMDYYVRVGVCCNDTYKKYNYTTIVKLHVP
ncbi:MAG: DUF3823 domain-containing protein [Prevotellaceae bacterium]|jgi:hypothetical protein|nr:DUF3823 domain-containing protein [Prevotellaceae bacterium]